MKKIFALLSLVLLASVMATEAFAQARTVTGRVTSAETGQPLAGVTVLVKGTSLLTRTDAQGRYSVNAPASANTLTFSSLDYGARDVAIVGTTVDVQLTRQIIALEGVVVTGLGVERQKSQLGTAQQQVSADALTGTHTQNVMSQLQGKVSGVNITNAGTPGGSVNINIRGMNSISGNNQPLFIVDGTPVSNNNRGGGIVSGYDFGNAISDLNANDIESITVLKGPNAAAIYGSRAANGVILVTTKRGRAGGIQTSASMTYDWARPSILPDFQNQYGQGGSGKFAYVDGAGGGTNDYMDQSYGPRLDGQLIDQFTGAQQPWVSHPNNVHDYFDTGHTLTTHVAVSGGTDRATGRLSLGVDNTDGYVPNNSFRKISSLLSANLDVSDKLSTHGSLEYIRDNGRNRVGSGYSGSPLEQFFWFGRQIDINDLRNYKLGGATNNGPANREYNWNYNYHNNPFWLQYENPESDSRDRITVTGSADYQLTDWIRATLRSGSDIYRRNIEEKFADQNLNFTDVAYAGGFTFIDDYNNENNTDLILTADRNLGDRLAMSATAGAGARREYYSVKGQRTVGISVPGIYNVSNAAVAPTLDQTVRRRAVNSGYGSLSFTWDGWWTVEGTGRNDWSSTLPVGENSYFYPSINTSIVLTDAIPSLQSGFLSYAKIRGSIARVGNDADPYQLLTTFTGNANKFQGLPQFSLGNSLANGALKPELTTSNEAGLELGLLDGRATIDATYYSKATRNQIFNVPISSTSGFSTKAVNAGEITNKGWEALVSVTPLELDNGFRWTSTVNWAKNRSEITDLYPGIQTIILGDAQTGRASIFGDVQIQARKGKPYGAIYGADFAKDDNGNIQVNSRGLPLAADTLSYFGTVQPDWTGGWMNEFSYGAFTLNVLFDAKHGGKLYSYTNMVGETSGVLEQTLRGREVDWNKPGIVVNGVSASTGAPNTINVSSEQYFQSLFGIVTPYVYDAGYVKLREMRLGFDVPASWTNRFGTSGMNIALTGRNLITWKNVPNIDPEFALSTNNWQGVEYAMVSNPRSIGLSIQIRP